MLDFQKLRFTREGAMPQLSLTHVRFAGARDGQRVVASCCDFARLASAESQAQQRAAAEALRSAQHPVLTQIQDIHVAADAQIVFSQLPVGQSLAATLIKHSQLEVEETLQLAERLAEVCDLAWSNAWPRLRIAPEAVWIGQDMTQAQLMVPDIPCFGAEAALLESGMQGSTVNFEPGLFLELQESPIVRQPSDYTGALAHLICEMLGQGVSTSRGNSRVAPITQLTARQNTILRQALSPTQRQQFSTVAEFVRWLWDRDSSAILPADLSSMRTGSAPPSPATTRPPFAVAYGLTQPVETPSTAPKTETPPPLPSLVTASPPPLLEHSQPSTTRVIEGLASGNKVSSSPPLTLSLAPAWRDKKFAPCTRLRLSPVGHIGPIIGLAATETVVFGRGPDADYMAFYWPQTPTNQSRTRLVGRTQATLRRSGRGPVLEPSEASNPTLWQGCEAPMNTPFTLPLVLELGGDYRVLVEALPHPPVRREVEGLSLSDNIITLLPSLRCRPGEHDAGPFILLWLGLEAPLHMPSQAASRASGVLQEMHVGNEPAAIIHWRSDTFFIEAPFHGPLVEMEGEVLAPGFLWPLEVGKSVIIAGRKFVVKL